MNEQQTQTDWNVTIDNAYRQFDTAKRDAEQHAAWCAAHIEDIHADHLDMLAHLNGRVTAWQMILDAAHRGLYESNR